MYSYCLNFQDRKIEKMYNYTIVSIDFDFERDYYEQNFANINTLIESKIETYKGNEPNLLVQLYITSTDPKNITKDEQRDFINRVARSTLTKEETGRGYLSIPLWFKNKVFLPAITQNRLGNFKNSFKRLQIELYINNELEERMVQK